MRHLLKVLRYLCTVLLLVWMGAIVTLTFVVAPSLFGNESGVVPDSTTAGKIIAPMLHKMEVIGWVALPLVVLLHGAMYVWFRRRVGQAFFVSLILVAGAWAMGLYTGLPLTHEMRDIRVRLEANYGGYHNAPPEHPLRSRFARLHGLAMVLTLARLGMGLGSLFCVTQLIDESRCSYGPDFDR